MSNLDKANLSIGEILADWNPRDEIREGSKAHINEEPLTIEIDTGHCGYTYQVDLERCNTPAQVLDWIFHGNSLQGCLCPCGVPQQITWPRIGTDK